MIAVWVYRVVVCVYIVGNRDIIGVAFADLRPGKYSICLHVKSQDQTVVFTLLRVLDPLTPLCTKMWVQANVTQGAQ